MRPQDIERWNAHYTSGSYRNEWHLEVPSPELCALVAAEVITGGNALDLGCGAGTEAVYLATLGFRVWALDIAPLALRLVDDRAAQAGVEVTTVHAAVPETGLPDATFDFINDRSCLHTMQPTPDMLRAYAAEAWRLLAPGGVLLMRRFGQKTVTRAEIEEAFARFSRGNMQDSRFVAPHFPSRIAVFRKPIPA